MFNTKFSSLGGKLNTNFSSSTNEFDSEFKESSVVKGEDGFSPIVSLSKEGSVTTLEITDKEGSQKVKILDGTDLTEEVQLLFQRLNSNATLGFYCVEDVDVVVNDVVTTYPANSNVEIRLLDTDKFEIIPTSDHSIMILNAFPGALGVFYPWLEGVK